MKFYRCQHCGNTINYIENKGVPVICCGQKMTEIIPAAVDASAEKHIPIVTVDSCKVTVNIGSVAHPMTPEHSIEWVFIETAQGTQCKILGGDVPAVEFAITDNDKFIRAYAYCNLHGLWEGK